MQWPTFMRPKIIPNNKKSNSTYSILPERSNVEKTKNKNKVGTKQNNIIFTSNNKEKSYVEKNKVKQKPSNLIFISNNNLRSYETKKNNFNNQIRTRRNISDTTKTIPKENIQYIFKEYEAAKNRNSQIQVLKKIYDYSTNNNNKNTKNKIDNFFKKELKKYEKTNYGKILELYYGIVLNKRTSTQKLYVPSK